jgi:hypothetical protein
MARLEPYYIGQSGKSSDGGAQSALCSRTLVKDTLKWHRVCILEQLYNISFIWVFCTPGSDSAWMHILHDRQRVNSVMILEFFLHTKKGVWLSGIRNCDEVFLFWNYISPVVGQKTATWVASNLLPYGWASALKPRNFTHWTDFNRVVTASKVSECKASFGWLVAGGWCWFVVGEKYCWLAGDWWLVRN